MKIAMMKFAGAALVVAMATSPANARFGGEAEFEQCVMDCQDFAPDTATVNRCMNWCLATFNPG